MNDFTYPPIAEYAYNLPDEKIAKYPLEQRDSSKLLVYKNQEIIDSSFSQCVNFLPSGSLMVFNNTKVIQARIHLHKSTGAHIEIFCLEPHTPSNYEQNLSATQHCTWHCLVGNAKKWKQEPLYTTIHIANTEITFTATKKEIADNSYSIEFSWTGGHTFGEVLEAIGKLPIPPYLHRETEDIDIIRYQTMYAQQHGSVAAPTAGLHFTPEVLQACTNKNIPHNYVTLHVGAGTFKPVTSTHVNQHRMHREYFTVQATCIQDIIQHQSHIIAVGTTSVRTLESLYWIGVKLHLNMAHPFEISQWEPYQLPQHISVEQSLTAILDWCNSHNIQSIEAYTQIMIIPGYSWNIVSTMFTNFHQPQSTLLLLVASFIGEQWKSIYEHALNNNYRFLSYGDSSLLCRTQTMSECCNV
ncbi:MAG TPA: S-adenosylmethionine:tRNA ribosyltransferase-isomerase [Bacteroidales bacterium]|nr:S-adenosylmethionine:tRNA ribosyltransferase-isomerase [Bacteroidales bacterium]